jgi:hypothetical protein
MVSGGEMAMDETIDKACHVGLTPLPGSLESFQMDLLQSVWCPLVATLEIVE